MEKLSEMEFGDMCKQKSATHFKTNHFGIHMDKDNVQCIATKGKNWLLFLQVKLLFVDKRGNECVPNLRLCAEGLWPQPQSGFKSKSNHGQIRVVVLGTVLELLMLDRACSEAMLVAELACPGILAVEQFCGCGALLSPARSGIMSLQTEDYRGSAAGLVHHVSSKAFGNKC